MDVFTNEQRSRIMSRIRGRDTKPEMIVRRLAHRLGYRYRVHVSALPGCPDLVFPSRRKVILVNGCFWHRHPECRYASTPKSNVDFWRSKFAANVARDERVLRSIEGAGWKPIVVWECETRDVEHLSRLLIGQLGVAGGAS